MLSVDVTELGAEKTVNISQHSDASLDTMLDDAERSQILHALELAGGIVSDAAVRFESTQINADEPYAETRNSLAGHHVPKQEIRKGLLHKLNFTIGI